MKRGCHAAVGVFLRAWLPTLVLTAAGHVAAEPEDALETIEDRLVAVTVSFQAPDPFQPWQNRAPGRRSGYAIRIGPSQYITTENLVRNHKLVELQRARAGELRPAAVVMSDPYLGLALLSTDGIVSNLPPLALVDELARQDGVSILQLDETGELQRGDGHVLQISVEELPGAPHVGLAYSLLTDLNVNGEGAPVVVAERLAGLVTAYHSSSRVAKMLPYAVLRRFLKEATRTPYAGVPIAGFSWTPLIDPSHRAYLGADRQNGGVLVLASVPGTGAAEAFMPNDVIVKWDGYPIDNLGFYADPEFGRLLFAYLIQGRRAVGETVPVVIVRDRREQTVNVKLSRFVDEAALIPENVVGARPEYLIEGGFVLRELDGSYLRAHGGAWENKVDPRLVNFYLTRKLAPESPGQRIIILVGVLPHNINVSYQQFHSAVVKTVNGRPVNNMADVFDAVDEDGCLERLGLQSVGVDLVLDKAALPEANQEISRRYGIPRLKYRRTP